MIKTIITSMLLLLAVLPARAEKVECATLYSLSRTVMEYRQAGLPQDILLDNLVDNEAKSLVSQIIRQAYSIPIVSNEADSDLITTYFANEIFLVCNDVMTDKEKNP